MEQPTDTDLAACIKQEKPKDADQLAEEQWLLKSAVAERQEEDLAIKSEVKKEVKEVVSDEELDTNSENESDKENCDKDKMKSRVNRRSVHCVVRDF